MSDLQQMSLMKRRMTKMLTSRDASVTHKFSSSHQYNLADTRQAHTGTKNPNTHRQLHTLKMHKNIFPTRQIPQKPHTFMRKKSSRMTKTLTSGCSQAAERPRPTGGGDPEIFVHVKLSNKELMHSLGIYWREVR